MNKKIANVLCYLLLIFLFIECKKEKSVTPNINTINLLVLNPFRLDSTGPTSYTYKLRGSIVAPSKIDMTDHGFLVKGNGSPIQVKKGSANKIGYVEYDYPSTYQLLESDVVLYAILKTGDTLYSNSSSGNNIPGFINPDLQLKVFNLTPLPGNDIFLNSDFTYNTASGYSVTTYELLYKQSTAPNFNSFSLFPYSNGNQVSNLSLVQKLGISQGISYDFEIHITVSPPSGSSNGPFDLPTAISSSSY